MAERPLNQNPFFGGKSFTEWFTLASAVGSLQTYSDVLVQTTDVVDFQRRWKDQLVTQVTLAGESAEFTIRVPSDEAWLIHLLQVQSGVIQRWLLTRGSTPGTPVIPSAILARIKTEGDQPVPLIMNVRHDFVSTKDFFTVAPYYALPNTELTILPDGVQGADTSFIVLYYEQAPIPASRSSADVITSEAV